MYTISVKTFSGKEVEKSVIEKDYAIFIFKAFMSAMDAEEVVMIDRLTGEVLYLYTNGKWEIFNGETIF